MRRTTPLTLLVLALAAAGWLQLRRARRESATARAAALTARFEADVTAQHLNRRRPAGDRPPKGDV
ncbi:hypothetical protein ACIF6L_34950 [Kitasatospora sp. NPDC086009]|uniref:hypothetical protein n=1 Tax=unclassified Kitasatospora TaxID=2633591 RepID=UPI0037C7A674